MAFHSIPCRMICCCIWTRRRWPKPSIKTYQDKAEQVKIQEVLDPKSSSIHIIWVELLFHAWSLLLEDFESLPGEFRFMVTNGMARNWMHSIDCLACFQHLMLRTSTRSCCKALSPTLEKPAGSKKPKGSMAPTLRLRLLRISASGVGGQYSYDIVRSYNIHDVLHSSVFISFICIFYLTSPKVLTWCASYLSISLSTWFEVDFKICELCFTGVWLMAAPAWKGRRVVVLEAHLLLLHAEGMLCRGSSRPKQSQSNRLGKTCQ